MVDSEFTHTITYSITVNTFRIARGEAKSERYKDKQRPLHFLHLTEW
jgi:hypothetical protein